MKTKSYFVYLFSSFLISCHLADAQVIWLSTKNLDFTGCDSQERKVNPFTAVTNTCPFDVIFEQSNEQYVIVEGDEDIFENLHTDVRNGELEISIDRARYRNVRLRVRVGCPDITKLNMAGSGSIQCNTDIVTDGNLTLRVAGNGDLNTGFVKCASLETSVAGSGDLRAKVIEANDIEVVVAGSGDWSALEVLARNLSVGLTGSGDIDIDQATVDNKLTASVTGSGDIQVSGKANDVDAKVIGSGDISGKLTYKTINRTKSGSGDIDW
jgi:hypothetical protein